MKLFNINNQICLIKYYLTNWILIKNYSYLLIKAELDKLNIKPLVLMQISKW